MTVTAPEITDVPFLSTPQEALAAADALSAELADGSAERERSGASLLPQLRRVAESGLLGIVVPAEHGGPGLPAATKVDVLRRLSRGDGAVGQLLLSHFVIGQAISGLGRQEPANRIYADILAGAQLGNASAERGTATALDRRVTVAKRDDGSWVLNGTKYYATGALGATWIAVAAVIADRAGETATVFVRPDQDGVTLALDKWSAFGQRGTASGEVRLADVVVDGDLVVEEGAAPDPVDGPPSVLGAYDQALHAAVDIGIARAALEDGAAFVHTTSRPWKEAVLAGVSRADEEPHVVRRFGELTARLYALEALLAAGTAVVDRGLAEDELSRDTAAEASLKIAAAKALAQEYAVEIASGIFELTGTSGTDSAVNLDRHWRNVRTHSLHDPARWKYVHLGNHTLRGTRPPRLGLVL
ncbi:acyl-CoA dehydrogenase [Mycolicibacterium mageritense DSM 44476 = CIP 104973]|uniref:Dibenzothiophene monooxygenase n=1 Tax=Mycolicibacterium mageritense TaxID=53462 RepID=A0ABM7I3E1_MYCME|nr:acyl-CoA dehydrogenase family protein [Mycolicibacterium mageritense]MCC9185260.1 acyl-CoA dehydrogenase family protein [Mycolicibacterium mageritense]BBX37413.1 acyl-CoA dehydrogenase [Mycolicibacterium mageritense]CDO25920.1 acyl-CoA dehydrogenase [Mycolicibacterium mageritense DSM 44476 = CIP 104973]